MGVRKLEREERVALVAWVLLVLGGSALLVLRLA
jgi:hypothetical protein